MIILTQELNVGAQAKDAEREIAAGRNRGPQHGLPWGGKDLLAAKEIGPHGARADLKTIRLMKMQPLSSGWMRLERTVAKSAGRAGARATNGLAGLCAIRGTPKKGLKADHL